MVSRGTLSALNKKARLFKAGLFGLNVVGLLESVVAVRIIHEVDVLGVATGEDHVRVSFVVDSGDESVRSGSGSGFGAARDGGSWLLGVRVFKK